MELVGVLAKDNQLAILTKENGEYNLDVQTYKYPINDGSILSASCKWLDPDLARCCTISINLNQFYLFEIITDNNGLPLIKDFMEAIKLGDYTVFISIHNAFVHFQHDSEENNYGLNDPDNKNLTNVAKETLFNCHDFMESKKEMEEACKKFDKDIQDLLSESIQTDTIDEPITFDINPQEDHLTTLDDPYTEVSKQVKDELDEIKFKCEKDIYELTNISSVNEIQLPEVGSYSIVDSSDRITSNSNGTPELVE